MVGMLARIWAAYASRHFSTAVAADASAAPASVSRVRDSVGRRVFRLVRAKRSAVVVLQKWREEGHSIRKYELNRLVRELRKYKRYKHALEICEWMTIQEDVRLQPGDYAVHLDLIAKIRGLSSAEKFFEDIPRRMRGLHACTALLHTYAQNKKLEEAEATMRRMSECGLLKYALPFNHMLALYLETGNKQRIPDLIQDMKKTTTPDTVTYNLLLNMWSADDDMGSAEKLFLDMKKGGVDPDWVTYSTLTHMYIKHSLLEKSKSVLKELERTASLRQRPAFSSLLTLYTLAADKDQVRRIWKKMKSCFRKLNDAEYAIMLSSLLKLQCLEEAESLYAEWESISSSGDPRVSNVLLAAYTGNHNMEAAESFFRSMVKKGIHPSYTTWELLTRGHLKLKRVDNALDCFSRGIARVNKWVPNEGLVRDIQTILEEQGSIHGAEQLLITLRKARCVTTETYNSLLRTYGKASRLPLIVKERMKNDGVEPDEETDMLICSTRNLCVTEDSIGFHMGVV